MNALHSYQTISLSSNPFYTIQLIKAQVRRTTVEITVLLLTNCVTQPNYGIVIAFTQMKFCIG